MSFWATISMNITFKSSGVLETEDVLEDLVLNRVNGADRLFLGSEGNIITSYSKINDNLSPDAKKFNSGNSSSRNEYIKSMAFSGRVRDVEFSEEQANAIFKAVIESVNYWHNVDMAVFVYNSDLNTKILSSVAVYDGARLIFSHSITELSEPEISNDDLPF